MSTKAKLSALGWQRFGQIVVPGPTGPAGPQGPVSNPGFPLVGRVPFTTAGWTWLNQGAATVVDSTGMARFTCPSTAGENIRALVTPMPASGTRTTAVYGNIIDGANYQYFGITLHEIASGKFASLFVQNYRNFGYRKNANATTYTTGGDVGPANVAFPPGPFHVQAYVTATEYGFRWSIDGINFVLGFSEALAAWFTARPDRVGLAALVTTGTPSATYTTWQEAA